LARDPARLKSVRAKLAVNRSHMPLFDTTGFARRIESAFLALP
jgi:predicted O-linked N-acetylglucosamine transferase (SPINDLY family)